ncbi:hypothetical protein HYS82_01440, partial [Candidatus Amesbacteria bacterium]|nr:hypothetical protein [Candidatus Amesbacteria bacterium]
MPSKVTRFWVTVLPGVAALVLTSSALALESPHRYFDWNLTSSDPRVLSSHETASPEADLNRNLGEFGYVLGFSANWMPDHPLYFIKRIEEGVTLTLTFDRMKREEVR